MAAAAAEEAAGWVTADGDILRNRSCSGSFRNLHSYATKAAVGEGRARQSQAQPRRATWTTGL
eukprot:scaffold70142_cov57-Phaeocystis_antarctica.AAC.2